MPQLPTRFLHLPSNLIEYNLDNFLMRDHGDFLKVWYLQLKTKAITTTRNRKFIDICNHSHIYKYVINLHVLILYYAQLKSSSGISVSLDVYMYKVNVLWVLLLNNCN